MLIFIVLCFVVMKKIDETTDNKVKIILLGCLTLIITQSLIHIGVNIRILPTTGMTLPFELRRIIYFKYVYFIWHYSKFNKKENYLLMKNFIHWWVWRARSTALNIYDHLHNNFDISIITDKRGSRFIDNKLYKFDIIDTPKLSLNIFNLFFNIYFFYSLVKAFIYFKKIK